jgi:hypothetical protein
VETGQQARHDTSDNPGRPGALTEILEGLTLLGDGCVGRGFSYTVALELKSEADLAVATQNDTAT